MRTWCGSTAEPGQRLRALLGWARFIGHGGLWKKPPAYPLPERIQPRPGLVQCGQPERDRQVLQADVLEFLRRHNFTDTVLHAFIYDREGNTRYVTDLMIDYSLHAVRDQFNAQEDPAPAPQAPTPE